MVSPLKPHWVQPSHPDIQKVQLSPDGFLSKSFSRVNLPPFTLFAKMSWPPCAEAKESSYATVQFARDRHLILNSDLLYINHSCEPSLIFNTTTFEILAGSNGLKAGEELTFFYPSTEWFMAQPFDCLCGKPSCRGRISGAKDMTPKQLEGLFLNNHIHTILEERDAIRTDIHLSVNHSPAVSCYDTGSEYDSPGSYRPRNMKGEINGNMTKDKSNSTTQELGGEMDGDTVEA